MSNLVFSMQLVAELLGTYLSMFAGFAAMVINKKIMMVMIYTVGPVFGAHFNPAVTVAFASCKRVAWRNASFSILSYRNYSKKKLNNIQKKKT